MTYEGIYSDYEIAQNIWEKVRTSSQIGQGNKILVSAFAKTLTASVKIELRLDTGLRSDLSLRFSNHLLIS